MIYYWVKKVTVKQGEHQGMVNRWVELSVNTVFFSCYKIFHLHCISALRNDHTIFFQNMLQVILHK